MPHDDVATVRTATYCPIFDFPVDFSDVNHIAILLLHNNKENALSLGLSCQLVVLLYLNEAVGVANFYLFFSYQKKRYQKLGKFYKKSRQKVLLRKRETSKFQKVGYLPLGI